MNCRIALFLLALFMVAMGCSKKDDAYPAIVRVRVERSRALCSGTFVSPRAVLTAAHCVQVGKKHFVQSSFGRYTTSVVESFGNGEDFDPNDIAVLIFEKDVAKQGQFFALGNPPNLQTPLKIIGFGCNNVQTRRGAGKKRIGTNRIHRILAHLEFVTPVAQQVSIKTIHGPEGSAGICGGDSGGPALLESGSIPSIVGVSSSSTPGATQILSRFVDLSREDNRQFLKQVNEKYQLGIAGIE